MQEWSKENEGFRYMLNVVDVFSKYAWSIPMKDKTAITTLNAFKQIVESSKRKPKHIWVDKGKEFYNKRMDEWIEENNIIRYSTYRTSLQLQSTLIERLNKYVEKIYCRKYQQLDQHAR